MEIFEMLPFLFLRQLTPHAADGRSKLTDGQMRIPRLHLKPHLSYTKYEFNVPLDILFIGHLETIFLTNHVTSPSNTNITTTK